MTQAQPLDQTTADQFIAQHIKLFTSWRHEYGFESKEEDPIDLEARMTGSCLPRATLLAARCAGEGLHVEKVWCRMNGVPHAIVHHPESGLVSDHTLANPRTIAARHDLTDFWPLAQVLAHMDNDESTVSDV
jgi:hypothetical protein